LNGNRVLVQLFSRIATRRGAFNRRGHVTIRSLIGRDSWLRTTGSQVRTPKSQRVKSIVIIGIVVLGGTLFLFGLMYGISPSRPIATSQVWEQWGMSIQYPVGLSPQYQGVYQPQATSSSGEVSWTWNSGNTSLDLEWVPASVYNYSSDLQPISVRCPNGGTIRQVSQGNVTMSGTVWGYATLVCSANGSEVFATAAKSYSPVSHRGYLLVFTDVNSSTLASLETYGNTLHS
jgi:hypothetical protein